MAIGHVIVNTNGLKLAKNRAFCEELASRPERRDLSPVRRAVEESTHTWQIRGRDLTPGEGNEALENCASRSASRWSSPRQWKRA